MTEAEWGRAVGPEPMLAFLGPRASARKLRLFACACCRRHEYWVEGTPAAKAIGVAEAFADRRAPDKKLRAAHVQAQATASRFYAEYQQTTGVAPYIAHMHASACAEAAMPSPDRPRASGTYATSAANFVAQTYAYEMVDTLSVTDSDWHTHKAVEAAAHAALVRDIFGNPFRPVAPGAAWRTADVMLLAEGAYNERAFDRAPILADALQDAGCDSDDLLAHLRDPNALHVRGCWAIDLTLGRL